jgi:hypothetical protein
LTLPGIIDDPGSFSGKRSSPKPELEGKKPVRGGQEEQAKKQGHEPRTRAKETDIVGDFHQRDGNGVQSARGFNKSVVSGKSFNLQREAQVSEGRIEKQSRE